MRAAPSAETDQWFVSLFALLLCVSDSVAVTATRSSVWRWRVQVMRHGELIKNSDDDNVSPDKLMPGEIIKVRWLHGSMEAARRTVTCADVCRSTTATFPWTVFS